MMSDFITKRDYENSYIIKPDDVAIKRDGNSNELKYLCINCVKIETKEPVTLVHKTSSGVYPVKREDFNKVNVKEFPFLETCVKCKRIINFDYLKKIDEEKTIEAVNYIFEELEGYSHLILDTPIFDKFNQLYAIVNTLVKKYDMPIASKLTTLYRKNFDKLLAEYLA